MAGAGYIIKRILLMLAGYFFAILAGLIAVVIIYAALSALPGAPSYFDVMGVTPFLALAVPAVGMFIYLMAVALTGLQTLVFALLAEFFLLRSPWMHMLFGAAAAAGGFALIWPEATDEISGARWADIGIIACAGLVAGLFYWLIAGRSAGFRRPIQALPQRY